MVRFNYDQLKQLAEFISNLGLVLFATVIAPIFNIENFNPIMIVSGLVLTGFCLFLSLLILRNQKYDKS